jgi:hypothetical protein
VVVADPRRLLAREDSAAIEAPTAAWRSTARARPVQRARLEQDGVRHDDLADVVQQGGLVQEGDPRLGPVQRRGQRGGQGGDPLECSRVDGSFASMTRASARRR